MKNPLQRSKHLRRLCPLLQVGEKPRQPGLVVLLKRSRAKRGYPRLHISCRRLKRVLAIAGCNTQKRLPL